MKTDILKYIESKNANPGETVQYGWFIFKITGTPEKLSIKTLDFRNLASFTDELEIAEDIHSKQMQILNDLRLDPEWCNLQNYAIASKSYHPNAQDAFIKRQSVQKGNDSGWYVGVFSENLDLNNPKNLVPVSLYELSINDKRFLDYWLLPVGYEILYEGDFAEIRKP